MAPSPAPAAWSLRRSDATYFLSGVPPNSPLVPPQAVVQLLVADHLPGGRHQRAHQLDLQRRAAEIESVPMHGVADKRRARAGGQRAGLDPVALSRRRVRGPGAARHGAHTQEQLARIERLRDEVVGPRLVRLHQDLLVRGARDEDDWKPCVARARRANELQSAAVLHHIDDHTVRFPGLEDLARHPDACGDGDPVPVAAQRRGAHLRVRDVVVDQEDQHRRGDPARTQRDLARTQRSNERVVRITGRADEPEHRGRCIPASNATPRNRANA